MVNYKDYSDKADDIYKGMYGNGIEFMQKNKVELATLLAITDLINEVQSMREELKSTNKEVQKSVDTPKRK